MKRVAVVNATVAVSDRSVANSGFEVRLGYPARCLCAVTAVRCANRHLRTRLVARMTA